MEDLAENFNLLERDFFKKPINNNSIQLVSGGFSSAKNYRIADGEKTYLARFMSAKQPLASREKECLITAYVGKIGIGPKVYLQNPKQGILLTDFIDGRLASYDDMVNEPMRNLVIATIKKLHQPTEITFPKATTISSYIKTTLARIASNTVQQQLEVLDLVTPFNKLDLFEENNLATALIHNDLNPTNILINKNQVYIIDWTNAGFGDPFSDISWHAILFPITLHDTLLHYYFTDITTLMRQKLFCYYCLRLLLQAVWGIEQAKKLSPNYEQILIETLKQNNSPEPHSLCRDIANHKIVSTNPKHLLLYAASMLNSFAKLIKTGQFHA